MGTGPDEDGRKLWSKDHLGQVSGWEYEPATGRLSRAYTNTAASPHQDVRYTYDALGRLSTVAVHKLRNVSYATPLVTTYEYDLAGNLKRESQPNGLVTTHTIDELGRVTSSQAGWMQFNYTYRADGRRSKMTGGASGSATSSSYSYDALGRLTGETQDWNGNGLQDGSGTETDYAVTYTMDLVGNRTRKLTDKPGTTADETITSTYNAKDWLQTESASVNGGTATVTTYGYDLNGSMTSRTKGSTNDTFGYDLRDRMTSSTVGGVVSSYGYDDKDQRVKKVEGTATTLYHLDYQALTSYPQIVEEKSSQTAQPTVSYAFGLDELMQGKAGVSMSLNNVQQYVHDAHGNVRGLWSNFGGTNGIIERYDYDAYGNLVRAANLNGQTITTPNTNLLQPDGYRDFRLGWNRNGVRYVDPRTGRWTQQDDYLSRGGNPLQIHKLLYCQADPINLMDPSGLFFVASSFIFGQKVHDAIGAHYLQTQPAGVTRYYDNAVDVILGTTNTFFGNVRPDLAQVGTGWGSAYEIKPALTGYLAGSAQLGFYISVLNATDPTGRVWMPGISYIPPSVVSLGPATVAIISPPLNGVILYTVLDFREIISTVLAINIARLRLHLSIASTFAVKGVI